MDGFQEKYEYGEFMRAYKSCKNSDVSTVQAMLEYAWQYTPAKFELARLLINNPKDDIKQSERYASAGQILTELANNLDASYEAMAAVSLEQAKV